MSENVAGAETQTAETQTAENKGVIYTNAYNGKDIIIGVPREDREAVQKNLEKYAARHGGVDYLIGAGEAAKLGGQLKPEAKDDYVAIRKYIGKGKGKDGKGYVITTKYAPNLFTGLDYKKLVPNQHQHGDRYEAFDPVEIEARLKTSWDRGDKAMLATAAVQNELDGGQRTAEQQKQANEVDPQTQVFRASFNSAYKPFADAIKEVNAQLKKMSAEDVRNNPEQVRAYKASQEAYKQVRVEDYKACEQAMQQGENYVQAIMERVETFGQRVVKAKEQILAQREQSRQTTQSASKSSEIQLDPQLQAFLDARAAESEKQQEQLLAGLSAPAPTVAPAVSETKEQTADLAAEITQTPRQSRVHK